MNHSQNPRHEMGGVHWWHRIALPDGRVTPGVCDHDPKDARWGLPADLTNSRILDVGTWDGLFAFECERRGAKVVGIDVPQAQGGHWGGIFDGAHYAREALGSNAFFLRHSILDLIEDPIRDSAPEGFDLVLCFGVLYHLTDIIAGIRGLAAATKPGGTLLLETAYWDAPIDPCAAQYRPGHDGDDTNYWYPSRLCLKTMLQRAGFTGVEFFATHGERISVRATKA